MSEEFARLAATVETIAKRQDEMAGDIKEMRSWMNQQKGKAALLMGAGLLVGSIITAFFAFWNGK